MQDEQQDILYRAAEVWKELTEYHYVFTYGYKGELHEIKLTFSPEDFPHLAGFHYLKDLALPRYSPRKTVDMILSGKITHEKYFEWKLQWSFGSTITHSSPLSADIEALLQSEAEE